MDQSKVKSDFPGCGETGQRSQDVRQKTNDKIPVAPSIKTSKHRKPLSKEKKHEKLARPLSAYNVFVKEERVKLLAETEGKDADADDEADKFTRLGFEMGQRWKNLTPEEKAVYEGRAKDDVIRYQGELENWQEIEASPSSKGPKGVKGSDSPHTRWKSVNEQAQQIEKGDQSSIDLHTADLLGSGSSPALGAQMRAMCVDPQELMIQQLLASQHGTSLGQHQQHQTNAHIHSLGGQFGDREFILRQLQLQELADRQTAQLSQLLGGNNRFMGSPVFPGSGTFLQGFPSGNGHVTLSGLEQQLLIQRLQENELRNQIAAMERGLAAQQFQFPRQVNNAPVSNLDLLALHASSPPGNVQQGPVSAMDSEVLANMSVREKLQLLMRLNQQGYS